MTESERGPCDRVATSHSKCIHNASVPSVLSRESSATNYQGFYNLAICIVLANAFRLIFDNVKKYGILISFPVSGISNRDFFTILVASLLLPLTCFISLYSEYLLLLHSQSLLSAAVIAGNIFSLLLIPSLITWNYVAHPVVGLLYLGIHLAVALKLISYHFTNRELRLTHSSVNNPKKSPAASNSKSTTATAAYPECPYPTNLTLGNLAYFLFAPTLSYQPSYPRTDRIRMGRLLIYVGQILISLSLLNVLVVQYGFPILNNSMKALQEENMLKIVECLLKLSMTCLYVWLTFFYILFHAGLNLIAEMMRFGDRDFYRDWWNARSVADYWRKWNRPVHSWIKRHLYVPMIEAGVPPSMAMFVIFFLSALGHEYLVAIPTRIVRGWSFAIIFAQAPLFLLTELYGRWRPDSHFGNYVTWISICLIGEPICVFLYYHAWLNM